MKPSLREALVLVTTTTTVAGYRILQEEDQDQQQLNDDFYNEDDGTGANQYTAMINDLTDRVESDVNGMWDSAPSAWELEYWEVLGIVVGIVMGIVLFFCCCCCCFGGSGGGKGGGDVHAGDRIVGTSSQAEEYRKRKQQQKTALQEPILTTKASSHDKGEYSPAIVITSTHDEDFDDEDGLHRTSSSNVKNMTKTPKRKPNFMEKTAFVWKETISVWGEFLGLSNAVSTDERDSYYKEYKTMKKKSKQRKIKELV